MRVGELFAGIGGFGLGAQRAGHSVAWAVEIDPFARAVYGERFHGHILGRDVREFPSGPDEHYAVDCITAGFPCQDLSVAGKRKGLVGERSGLFWEIIRIARRLRPRWLLLENVPGLLSSHKGRDFETVLAALDELGYGVSWRVLDAQFFGVPQRRRRVFIVGHLGAECPAEVLFEPESLSGHTPQGRKARAGVTGGVAACLNSGGNDGGFRTEPGEHLVAGTLPATNHSSKQHDFESGLIVARPITATSYKGHDEDTDTIVASVVSNGDPHSGFRDEKGVVTHALTGEGFDAGEDGTGRGTPIVADTLAASYAKSVDHAGTHGAGPKNVVSIRPRRLTPRECERLQGFPDDWTLIDGASDSARYRALGNAVAVPVVEWILRRMGGSGQGDAT